MIRSDTLRVGDKLPSVRMLCRTRGVSPSTALSAYASLESAGLIHSRPRSGYFVSARPSPSVPRQSLPRSNSTRVAVSDLVFDILDASRDRDVVPLGSAFPNPHQFPWTNLARYLGSSARCGRGETNGSWSSLRADPLLSSNSRGCPRTSSCPTCACLEWTGGSCWRRSEIAIHRRYVWYCRATPTHARSCAPSARRTNIWPSHARARR